MKQNEKGLMQWEKDFLISVTILIIATIIAHIFFYQTAHNINVPMIYTLATFLYIGNFFYLKIYKRVWMGDCFLTFKRYFY